MSEGINSASFNASKLPEVVKLIDLTNDEFSNQFLTLAERWARISSIVRSEDSSLADSCLNTSDNYSKINTKTTNLLKYLSTNVTSYVNKTLQAEEEANRKTKEYNEDLDNITGEIDDVPDYASEDDTSEETVSDISESNNYGRGTGETTSSNNYDRGNI